MGRSLPAGFFSGGGVHGLHVSSRGGGVLPSSSRGCGGGGGEALPSSSRGGGEEGGDKGGEEGIPPTSSRGGGGEGGILVGSEAGACRGAGGLTGSGVFSQALGPVGAEAASRLERSRQPWTVVRHADRQLFKRTPAMPSMPWLMAQVSLHCANASSHSQKTGAACASPQNHSA